MIFFLWDVYQVPEICAFRVDFDVASLVSLRFEVNPRSSCTIRFLMSLYFFVLSQPCSRVK